MLKTLVDTNQPHATAPPSSASRNGTSEPNPDPRLDVDDRDRRAHIWGHFFQGCVLSTCAAASTAPPSSSPNNIMAVAQPNQFRTPPTAFNRASPRTIESEW